MLIYNAMLCTMTKPERIECGYIEIEGGLIKAIGAGNPPYIGENDFNAEGLAVYPGFIDAHTHLGIIENGLDFEGDDSNESTDPFTPQMRAIDGINPFDECFREARLRGVTTVSSGPGSANACGGIISAIKTNGSCVDDMEIAAVGVKFALGENPKNVYNSKGETPVTRMAIAATIREGLMKAKRYLSDLEDSKADEDMSPPDYDIKCESLIPLLNGEMKAFFHCHRADDICTAIRISKEFGLKPVIIHATEGHLIAEKLAKDDVPCICGPIICDRCKPEMKNLDITGCASLIKGNVNISICTDHPVIPVQYLPASALMAIKGGLSQFEALKAITCDAAKILGIDGVTGTLEVGKAADLQAYPLEMNPLDLLSEPTLVMIDGVIIQKV